MRYPSTDASGDFLIYHRLTGLGYGGNTTTDDVLKLVDAGMQLDPWEERIEEDDEYGPEMFGIDPIDIVAGDGGAVFCSPFAPVDPGMWAKSGFKSVPGVAFRLSDLLKRSQVSVRGADYQTFYLEVIDRGGLGDRFAQMTSQIEPWNQAFELEPLGEALRIVRMAETFDAFDALDAILRTGGAGVYAAGTAPGLGELQSAAQNASTFGEGWMDEDEDEGHSDAEITDALDASIEDAFRNAMQSWERVTPKTTEVLVWGSVPLSLAVLAFDQRQTVALIAGSEARGIAGIPAGPQT